MSVTLLPCRDEIKMVIWIIGLSGAGKTTIGREVYRQWNEFSPNTILLDGDHLRQVFAHDNQQTDYSVEGRRINASRAQALCRLLDEQGFNVVCCLLSAFESHRQENRKQLSQYFEVFIDVPLQSLISRDDKDLYQSAIEGNRRHVVGIDIPFERPTHPDLVINNSHIPDDIQRYAQQILEAAGITQKQGYYPYAEGALLVEPNTYFYSTYQGKAFIESWRQNRQNAANNDETLSPSCAYNPIYNSKESLVLTRKLLVDLIGSTSANREYWLPKLIKKFEISKRLYNCYQPDPPHRPAANANFYDLDCYLLFGELLSDSFFAEQQIQLVNVMLKLMDTLVSQSPVMTKVQRRQLNWLCEQEQKMVAAIEASLK
jgi:adenylylsulfate kinase-like enzyme